MWGDDTLFESQIRDFEAVEKDENKNVDENIDTQQMIDTVVQAYQKVGIGTTSGSGDDIIQDMIGSYWGERSDYEVREDGIFSEDAGELVSWENEKEFIASNCSEEDIRKLYDLALDRLATVGSKSDRLYDYPYDIERQDAERGDRKSEESKTNEEEVDEEVKTFVCDGCGEKLPLSKLSLSKGNKNYCRRCRGKAGVKTTEEVEKEHVTKDTVSHDPSFERTVEEFVKLEKDPNKNVDEAKLNEGEFSWHASDTDEPIYSTKGHQKTIYLIDDKGNKWKEDAYEGYGVFGGKDFYELLAEMNGLELTGDTGKDRERGIDLAFKDSASGEAEDVKYPKLVTDSDVAYEDVPNPRNHENQGWFEEGEDEHGSEWDRGDESKTNEEEVKEDTGFLSRTDAQDLCAAWELIGSMDDDPHVRTMADEKTQELHSFITAAESGEEGELGYKGGGPFNAPKERDGIRRRESKIDEQKLSAADVKKLFKSIDPLFAKHLTGVYGSRSQIIKRGLDVGLELSAEGEKIWSEVKN